MKTDEIKIQILADGTIRMEADKISAVNHSGAEAFVRECAREAGGSTSRKSKHKHGHSHAHEHTHNDEHHSH